MPAGKAGRLAGVLLCLLLGSCSTSIGKWTYPSGRYATTTSSKPGAASITVTPLLDARGSKNKTYMTWYYIPLFPFGWTDFDRPEATVHGSDTTNFAAEPCEDLARSLVIELRREGLVREVTYAGDYRVLPTATHVLRGRLRSFCVAEERWSYGLSVYSPILWSLLLPMGTSSNGFCADLELVDAKDGRVVWKDSIYDFDDHIEGYYYGPEWYRFSWMWERRLRQKLGGLALALGGEPAPLPAGLAEELKLAPAPVLPPGLGIDVVEENHP
ncbi:MAG TPA: hypothetical protein VE981_01465 [Planctomycetota bacterium]|nr:hypothetical protein [Planctomycetota bacterium]